MKSLGTLVKLLSVFAAAFVIVIALGVCYLVSIAKPNNLGFIDKNGNVVIDLNRYLDQNYLNPLSLFKPAPPPEKIASGLGDFSCGMAPIHFYEKDSAGFINEKGQAIGKFQQVEGFSEGLAAVLEDTVDGDRWGYVNAHGDFVIKPKYKDARAFSQGMAAVLIDGNWSYIDSRGKLIVNSDFGAALPFSDGLAAINLHGEMGCIERSGKYVLKPVYDKVYPSSCGITVAENKIGRKDNRDSHLSLKQFYFDRHGELLFDKERHPVDWHYLELEPYWGPSRKLSGDSICALGVSETPSFSEDLAVVQVGSKFGYMNKSGAVVIPATFDYAFNFSEGLAIVYKDESNGLLAYIDRTGKLITPFKFKFAQPFSEGLAVVSEQEDPLCGYINKTGDYTIKPAYGLASSFKEGKARIGACSSYL